MASTLSKVVLPLFMFICCAHCSINFYPRIPDSIPIHRRSDNKHLILTDYIEAGQAAKAKNLSQVILPGLNITSYSGYFRVNATVDRTLNASLFFWFFPAEVNASLAPLLVWLNGGPGAPSMEGLFLEHGPLVLSETNGFVQIQKRTTHWTFNHNVIYIDNPVGAGFSYAQHPDLYARNEVQVGENLYIALTQFYKVFPEFAKNDFYLAGESYGGKYVADFALTIHVNNVDAKIEIPLKGITIGNGLCDPANMLVYSNYLNQVGLVDDHGKNLLEQKEKEAAKLVEENKWSEAVDVFYSIVNGGLNDIGSIKNVTGFSKLFNYLVPELDASRYFRMYELFRNDSLRKSIHVGDVSFAFANKVGKFLKEDIMKSVKSSIETLVNATEKNSNKKKYKVMFYNGQLDIIVGHPTTVNFLKKLEWTGKQEYSKARRSIWYYKKEIAGYVRKVENLYEVLVRNAGHLVPIDQPEWAFDLITRFTSGEL
uniref:Carboxypeptidase n=1 Tax=Cacopsylla melanoneura TaxID=428564 RepID=A0A8D9E8A7_9HEMI